jgi:excinuclease UvrABC nuclease subunit
MGWSCALFTHRIESSIPPTSGIYAYMKVIRHFGLIKSVEHLYVGKSKNLRKRFNQHLNPLDPNPVFKDIGKDTSVEFWWIKIPVNELSTVEKSLIKELNPIGNIIGKNKGGN